MSKVSLPTQSDAFFQLLDSEVTTDEKTLMVKWNRCRVFLHDRNKSNVRNIVFFFNCKKNLKNLTVNHREIARFSRQRPMCFL